MSKYIIFDDKENTGQSSPSTGSKKHLRHPLRELSRDDVESRNKFYEFSVSVDAMTWMTCTDDGQSTVAPALRKNKSPLDAASTTHVARGAPRTTALRSMR